MSAQEPRGITAAQAIEHARFTTVGAGGEFPAAVDPFALVNEAGEWLVSAHQWQWTTSRMTTLGVTAGQDHVWLPDDFGGDLAQQHVNSLTSSLRLVTLQELLELRSISPVASQLEYVASVGYEVPPGGGEPRPRLLIYPTPSADEEEVFRIFYTARWYYVGEASDLLVLPAYCTTLYLEALTHIARGRMEEDSGTVAQRLQGLMASDLFRAATKADARTHSNLGMMRNTHTVPMTSIMARGWPYNWRTVADPS